MGSEFTHVELEKLEEFRRRLTDILEPDILKDDYFLIRWLRARSLDVTKAEEMLRKSLKWRKEKDVDGIDLREEVPLKYRKCYPFATIGCDRDGNLIILFPMGRYNHRIVIEDVGLPQFLHYNIVWVERIIRKLRDLETSSGKKGLRLVQIVDMEGYTYKELAYKPGLDYILETQKVFDENYPEMLREVMIINAPRIFTLLFNLVKPLVSKETQDKISVYGPNEEQWKQVLRQKFDSSNFPTRWGGGLEGSDPFCTQDTNVWPDGPVQLSYFSKDLASEDEGFTKKKIGARDKFKVEIKVLNKNCELKWKFWTESHDIGFQVDGPSDHNLVGWSRTDSQNEVKEGSINCKEVTGTFRIVFDNSYSYTKAKVLYYRVDWVDLNPKDN